MNPNFRAGDRTVHNLQRARELRRNATDAERTLWRLLRDEAFAKWKFRRQHEFGPFILDFFCAQANLVVEVDGGQHYSDEGAAADEQRSKVLGFSGITVLRFTNTQVLLERDAVAEAIRLALTGS